MTRDNNRFYTPCLEANDHKLCLTEDKQRVAVYQKKDGEGYIYLGSVSVVTLVIRAKSGRSPGP